MPSFSSRPPKRVRGAIPLLASLLAILLMLLLLPRTILPVPSLQPPAARPYYVRANKPFPECAHRPAKSFLIVFQSRSGSTAITSHLKSHSGVYMTKLEYLDRLGISRDNVTGAITETRAFFEAGMRQGLVPGFKIRAHHILGEPRWAGLINEYDTRVIWQYRKNVVKSALGTYQKEVLGDATAISGIKKDQLFTDRCSMGVGCKFRIDDMAIFHSLLKKRVHYQDMITKAVNILDGGRSCTLEVPYEDYLYYPAETIADMLTFLGLSKEITYTDRVKATSDSLCDVVENFEELCYSFYGCAGWQPYFDDFVNDCRCSNFSSGSVEFCRVDL